MKCQYKLNLVLLVSIRKVSFSALGRWDRQPIWPLPSAVARAGSRRSARRYRSSPPRKPLISLPGQKMPTFRIGNCQSLIRGFRMDTNYTLRLKLGDVFLQAAGHITAASLNVQGSIAFSTYACNMVKMLIRSTMAMLCFSVNRKMLPSWPTRPEAAVATDMLCGEIILQLCASSSANSIRAYGA